MADVIENAPMLPIGNRGRPAKLLAKINANLKRRQDRPLNDAQRRFVERYLVHFTILIET